MLERLLCQPGKGTFESRLTAALSRFAGCLICAAYAAVLIGFALKSGFDFDPEALGIYLDSFSGLFNSFWFIILVTLVSITSLLPGLAAFFLGLVELKTKHGKKTAFWGFFGLVTGTINFYMIFKMITPS